MANQLKISFCFDGYVTTEAPKIKIYHNSNLLIDTNINGQNQWVDVDIELESVNGLTVDFYNKRPDHTTVDAQGNIVNDMWIDLKHIRFDDILIQPWFLNDGWYEPRYFDDFLKNYPNQPSKLPSQRIWHFPGIYYTGQFLENFWAWYHHERTARTTLDRKSVV